MDFLEVLSYSVSIRALLTASMVGVTCGLIGTFIVLRNMSLIGDALSHAILPGIYFAFIFVGYSTVGFFIGSVTAGLISAAVITYIQQQVKTRNDAAIGIVFTAMFSIGVMGISSLNNKQGNHLDLKDFLFGTVMGVSNEDIFLTFIIMVYTIVCIILFYRYFFITTFQPIISQTMGISTKAVHYFIMLILAFAVVAALRSVGVILVVAMLITPASTALLLSDRLQKVLMLSAAIGVISAVCGFVISVYFDTTPGPAMVIFATGLYALAALLSPTKGVITKWLQQRSEKARIIQEDILKTINSAKHGKYDADLLAQLLGVPKEDISYHINKLKKAGLLKNEAELSITAAGDIKVENLVRAHRLWESYQVSSMGMDKTQIHDDAERLEHHLSDEFLDELDERLGFPAKDPHGSPIPKRVEGIRLTTSILTKAYKISKQQRSDKVEAFLWELGISPDEVIVPKRKDAQQITISKGGKLITIPNQIAKNIRLEENMSNA